MALIKLFKRKLAVALTSSKSPEKGLSKCPPHSDELKSSLVDEVPPYSSSTKGRTLSNHDIEQICVRHTKLTRKQWRALPSATRSKYRSTVRRHFHELLRSDPSWIYVFYNQAWPEYCKIGVTNNVAQRISNYNVHCPNADFVCLRAEFFHNHDRWIADIYEHFADARYTGEWFKVPTTEACEYLLSLKEQSDAV